MVENKKHIRYLNCDNNYNNKKKDIKSLLNNTLKIYIIL